MEKIKAIKLEQKRVGVLLATPVWQAGKLTATSEIEYTEYHVIPLQMGDEKNVAQRYHEYALECFERIQTILKGKPQGKVLFQIITADPILAGLSGLLKTAALENPHFSGQVILAPSYMTADERARCLREEKSRGLDPLVTYEHGVRQVLRWQAVEEEQDKPPVAFRDDGVYLITGGLGALGLLFAREVAEQTSRATVVLTGRSELTVEKQSRLNGLSRASYRQVDLNDLNQVEQLISGIKDEYGRLDGILHCAGMIADNFILKKSSAEFSEVLSPKVTGTFNLDQASQDVALDFFELFSSFAGAMGNLGQADYATANGFLDQYASYRNGQVAAGRRHGRTRSVNWTLWQAGGMEIDRASLDVLERATGVQHLRTATGMEAFHRSLALPYAQILVGEGDLAQMRSALLAAAAVSSEPRVRQAEPMGRIDSENLARRTQDFLRRQLSSVLKLPANLIDPEAALEQYGIDSILAMKLTSELELTFGRLSKTLFFEYATIGALTQYFIQSHSARLVTLFQAQADGEGQMKPADTLPETRRPARLERVSSEPRSRSRRAAINGAAESDPVAIIGLSGRYPEAMDIDAYWQNLRDGKDCIVEVPKDRWDWREYFSEDRTQGGHHYSKWGGFIAGVDEFDPLFFNISPKEAK
ncbi:MAG: SDR family NAD(P)-dependent oxidoreductase, partial [Acidobacteriota bacterium]